MINSILDTDLYKITQAQLALFGRTAGVSYSEVNVQYDFINRGKTSFPPDFALHLSDDVKLMKDLRLFPKEEKWLKSNCPYLKQAFLEWFRGYRFNPEEVSIEQNGGDLSVQIKGPWFRTIFWEVPLLALISELYFQDKKPDALWEYRCTDKAFNLGENDCLIADFGTRRRFSYQIQDRMVQLMKQHCKTFVGTSNVHLAMKHKVKPIGTHAHELFMLHGALFGYRLANHYSLQAWIDEFQGELDTALTDTFTTDVFFRDFDKVFSEVFGSLRQDSGLPVEFAEKAIAHYKKLGIDPLSKTIIFSDGLTDEKAVEIRKWCEGKIKCSFGIGTALSNDVGCDPLNIVIKMTGVEYKGQHYPTVKLSDVEGKHTGDPEEIEICKKMLKII